MRQEDGSREKYQIFFGEMDKDDSKTIEYDFASIPKQLLLFIPFDGQAPLTFLFSPPLDRPQDRMVELAARHGFYMDGVSISASEESGDEIQQDYKSTSTPVPPAPEWTYSSRQDAPGIATKSRDHRGVSFYDMQRIFAVLVRLNGLAY